MLVVSRIMQKRKQSANETMTCRWLMVAPRGLADAGWLMARSPAWAHGCGATPGCRAQQRQLANEQESPVAERLAESPR